MDGGRLRIGLNDLAAAAVSVGAALRSSSTDELCSRYGVQPADLLDVAHRVGAEVTRDEAMALGMLIGLSLAYPPRVADGSYVDELT